MAKKQSDTIRVQITENALRDTDSDTGQFYSLSDGDVVTVPRLCGLRWLSYGWAKDVDGELPTGDRIPGAREALDPHDGSFGGH